MSEFSQGDRVVNQRNAVSGVVINTRPCYCPDNPGSWVLVLVRMDNGLERHFHSFSLQKESA